MNSEGIRRWSSVIAPASNIAITASYTGTAVWSDENERRRLSGDYYETYTESISIVPGVKNVTRVLPTTALGDINSPPASTFHLYTGDDALGFASPPDAKWFRSRRVKLDAVIRFVVTQTINWSSVYTSIAPAPPPSPPANTSGSSTSDVNLDLSIFLAGTAGGMDVEWTYNLSPVNPPIVLTELFTAAVAVNPFTMKTVAGDLVDCGFTDSDTTGLAPVIPGFDVVSESGTHSVTVVVS